MSCKRHIVVAGGLCLASVLALPGCAANRAARPVTDWKRVFFPFRTARAAETLEQPAETLGPQSALENPSAPGDLADEYYNPRNSLPAPSRESGKPPLAPPAEDPGYLSDENPSRSATGVKADSGRPAKLRDVFENFGRRQEPRPAPAIPLDEPVADADGHHATHVVGYEHVESVTLGRPDFSEAAE